MEFCVCFSPQDAGLLRRASPRGEQPRLEIPGRPEVSDDTELSRPNRPSVQTLEWRFTLAARYPFARDPQLISIKKGLCQLVVYFRLGN